MAKEANTLKNLNGKSWYRFLKVIYAIAYIIAILFIAEAAWISRPQNHVDISFDFDCFYEKGSAATTSLGNKQYNYNLPPTHTLFETGMIPPTGSREEEASTIDQYLKNYCQQRANNSLYWFWYPNSLVGTSDDPSFNLMYALKNKTTGSQQEDIEIAVFGLLGVYFGFEIIKRIFYYIVLGTAAPKE